MTHERRSLGNVGVEIKFDGKIPFRTKRNCFSPIKKNNNKQSFINILGNHLKEEGCHVIHAKGDGDHTIAQTAVK